MVRYEGKGKTEIFSIVISSVGIKILTGFLFFNKFTLIYHTNLSLVNKLFYT